MADWEVVVPGNDWEVVVPAEEERGILRRAEDQVTAGALAASDLLTGGAGSVITTPKGLYDVARGDLTPTQALEGVGEAGHATAEAASGYMSSEQKEDLRKKGAYTYPMEVLNQVFQGAGNIAGAARYYGGQLLGEDEAQSNQRAGELGAGAQLGLFASAPFIRGNAPRPPARPSAKYNEAVRKTYETETPVEAPPSTPVDWVRETIGGKKPEPVRPEPEAVLYEVPERAGRPIPDETPADAVRRFQERGGEAGPPVMTEAEATARAVREFRERGAAPEQTLPPRGETGAVGHIERMSRLERDRERFQEELRDAQGREEKDTVKFFKEAIEEVTAEIKELQSKFTEGTIDPFKGPGRRQTGALIFQGDPIAKIESAFNFIKKNWPRFSEVKDVRVISNSTFDSMQGGQPNPNIHAFWDHTDGVVYLPEKIIALDTSSIVSIIAHELMHGRDSVKRPYSRRTKDFWGTKEQIANEKEYLKIPAEVRAFRAEDTAQTRFLTGGPGKRQRGMFDPSAFRLRREQGDKKTEFEKEQNLPAGGGLALPDTEGPVLDRVVETLAIGEDLNRIQGTPQKLVLPNDVGSFLGKYGLTSEHVSKFYADNPLVKTIIDRMTQIDQKFGDLLESFMKGANLVGKRGLTALRYTRRIPEGFSKIERNLTKTETESLYKAWLEFDNAQILRDNNLQYPTREMLIEKGYSGKVADSYLAEAEYMKSIYMLINEGRALTGKNPIEFLPGHFPHSYKGNIGIKILRRVQDEHGMPKDVTVGYTRTSGSQKSIDKVIKDLMNDVYRELAETGQENVNLRAEQVRTDKPGNMSDMMDAFESTAEVYSSATHPLTKLVKKVLDNRIASMEQQFLASSLHRSGVKGWLGYTGVTSKNLKDLQTARTSYITNAVKYARSQMMLSIMNEIPANVWAEVNKRLPHTAEYIENFVDVARERVPLGGGDKFIMNMFDSIFGPWMGYRSPLGGVNNLRRFFSWKDLAWSVSYHTANMLQPTVYAPPTLLREASRMGKGDVALSIARGEIEFVNPSLETKRAMEFGAKNKYIAPKLMEEIDFSIFQTDNKLKEFGHEFITGRRSSELNEAVGRARTYLQAYYFYKSAGFNAHQAMRAAGKLTDDVMVNYSKVGQPLWLSNNPFGQMVGKLVAPYAQFQFSHWGHVALALQQIKNHPKSAKAWAPFIELQAAGLFFAGVRGIIGFTELAALWTGLNMAYEAATGKKSEWPDIRTAMVQAGFNDFLMFGAISTASKQVPGMKHGADVGASMASPGVSSLVIPRQVTGTAEIITNTVTAMGKIILSKELTASEKYLALKSILPSWMNGAFLEPSFEVSDRVSASTSNRMRGGVLRDEDDRRALYWTNRRSLKEERERIVSQSLLKEKRSRNELKADLVELAADQLDRRGEVDEETIRKSVEAGYQPREFRRRVLELRRERQRSQVERLTRRKEATRDLMMQRRRLEDLNDDLEAYQR